MAKKNKKDKKKSKGKKKFSGHLILTISVLLAALFLPTTLMLGIGMVPTFVLLFVCWGQKKSKIVTVGSANFVGCAPYVFKLWQMEHGIGDALHMILNPSVIMVMYGAAGVGYVIDWGVSRLVVGIVRERAKGQLKFIRKRQEDLEARWGKKVRGDIPLDDQGFPLQK